MDRPTVDESSLGVQAISQDAEKLALSRADTQTVQDPAQSPVNQDTPITHLYLTFATELPTVPALDPEKPIGDSLPPCPDLSKFISPTKWGPALKNTHLVLSCIATFLTSYSAGSYSPPTQNIANDFHVSHVATLAGITTFCMGFALAPMALAPISEIWGRYPVFVAAGIIYVGFQAVCAVSPDLACLLVARFFVGVGGSVYSTVVGGVIADMYEKHDRNTAMAVFSGCVMAGTGAGPLVAAAIIESIPDPTEAWKWCFWHQLIANSTLLVFILFLFKEPRGGVILRRKANALNKWYDEIEKAGVYGLYFSDPEKAAEATSASSSAAMLRQGQLGGEDQKPQTLEHTRRIRWLIKEDERRASALKMITNSVSRPFYMLFTEPVVFSFSLWAAFSWGVLYLSFSVVPYLYGSDFDMSFRVYVAMIAASCVATVVGVWQEDFLKHPEWKKRGPDDGPYSDSKFWAFMRRRFPAESPEARLYFTCITAILLPAGLLGGFLCPSSMSGYSTAVGLGFATWGIYSVYLAAFNYLADTYGIYASSALAAQSFCRNVLGGVFPLVTGSMFATLGAKGAGGLLGGISAILTLIPWCLVLFGERIRGQSKFAISLQS